MDRPRSIVALLLRLATLHARRQPVRSAAVLSCVLAVLTVLVWPRHRMAAPAHEALQAGVIRNGFVLTHATEAGRRILELDAQGQARRELALPHADDRRVVGTRTGTAIAWQDKKKIRLARVEDGRDLGTWGKTVRHLCDGVASNDERFAVGWLEADDTVWIVHGPVAAGEFADTDGLWVSSAGLARTDWCGVASAEQNVAMLWREADRFLFTMCTKKGCSGFPARFRLEHRIPILGFGCLRNACLIAGRDTAGSAHLALVTEASQVKWDKTLDGASSTVSIVGVGDHAFAVGYATGTGSEVVRFDRDGAVTSLWRDPASTSTPALAWSSGRLLIAHRRGEALVHETLPLPR
jgi:hypothetical protein